MNKISKLYTTEDGDMYFWGVNHNEAPVDMPTSIDTDDNKEEKVTIETITEAPASITAEQNKYYRIEEAVETMAITLPEVSESDGIVSIIFMITAGSEPNITFTSTASDIYYNEGYVIEAEKTYEINCMWNGNTWIIASFEIKIS